MRFSPSRLSRGRSQPRTPQRVVSVLGAQPRRHLHRTTAPAWRGPRGPAAPPLCLAIQCHACPWHGRASARRPPFRINFQAGPRGGTPRPHARACALQTRQAAPLLYFSSSFPTRVDVWREGAAEGAAREQHAGDEQREAPTVAVGKPVWCQTRRSPGSDPPSVPHSHVHANTSTHAHAHAHSAPTHTARAHHAHARRATYTRPPN